MNGLSMPRLHLAALLTAGTLVLACTACSGTPSTPAPAAAGTTSSAVSTPPAAPALDVAKVGSAVADAAKQATAVHVKGTMAQEGGTINGNRQLNPDSANGTTVTDAPATPARA